MASRKYKSKVIQTKPTHNAKLLNIGIRKTIDFFQQQHFIENVIQSLLYSVNLKDAWVLIGGDGRNYSKEAIERIIQVLAGNAVQKVFVSLNGHLPTSAASCVMRNMHCHLGLVITGGHNDPGNCGFLGLKIISPPGPGTHTEPPHLMQHMDVVSALRLLVQQNIPVREEIIHKTNLILKNLQSYSTCDKLTVDANDFGGTATTVSGRKFTIEVIDAISPYVDAVKEMFDFALIRDYIKHLKLMINCCNGVTGPIVKRIFVEELGISERKIINSFPLENFGKNSPDINQHSCKDFIERLEEDDCQFGAVINPDGCRCMIIGEECFIVPPSDSLAIITAHHRCIPFFQKNKLETVVRTICTSKAVDRVTDSLSLLLFEVPVGWNNFSCAMVSAKGKATLFGEESYGLGVSSESFGGDRDGIWTLLAWLSITAFCKKGVKEIVEEHWNTFGRSFFGRWDFCNIPSQEFDAFISHIREKTSLRFEKIKSGNFTRVEYLDPFGIDPNLQTEEAKKRNTEIVFNVENYVYPYGFITKSLLRDEKHQNYQINLMEDTRLIIRRSESTSSSSILRFYMEFRVEPGDKNILEDREAILQPFIEAAVKITKIQDFISFDVIPTLI